MIASRPRFSMDSRAPGINPFLRYQGQTEPRTSVSGLRRRVLRSSSHRCRLTEQAVERFLHAPVTLAGSSLEPWSVEHGDLASAVMDQPGVLKRLENFRDAHAAHAEHVRQELVGERELVVL